MDRGRHGGPQYGPPDGCYPPRVKVTVVIPALDEEERIAGAIESASAEGVDVVVVDGGSRDRTRESAVAAGAQVVDAPRGRARQLEAGARAARGDAIVFLHADTRLPEGFAPALRTALADPAVVGGAFRLRFDRPTTALRIVAWGARLRQALLGMPYGDQALFVRRETLEALGGVPEAPIMEDLDLVSAMRRRGRLALLALPATTSARRYLERGVLRTVLRNAVAAAGWWLGWERERLASWYRQ